MLKRIEYFIKNLLLIILSSLSKNSKSFNKELKIDPDTKILLIRINRIGDALVTTPFIHLLKTKKKCKIYILADRKNYFVFNNNPDINEVLIYDKSLSGFFKTIKTINSIKFDYIIDLHDDVSTTVSFIIAASKCENKIGLEKSNKSIFTQTVPRPDPNKYHVIERLCSFSKLLGFEYSKDELGVIYNPSVDSINKIETLLNNIFDKKRLLLGINISAGSDARFWKTENYKRLRENLKAYDINILLICHEKDYSEALKIIDERYILNPRKNFDLFAAAIQKLDMLFSPDTSAVFIADSKRVPVFGLYVKYRMNEMIWSPFNSDFDCVITEEQNLDNVQFHLVWNKFKPFLEKYLNQFNGF